MRQRAVVIDVKDDYAIVESSRRTMCDGCMKNGGCGGHCEITGLVADKGIMRAEAENKLGAKVGDTVELESDNKTILSYAALVFMLPIVVCVFFYLTAYRISNNELTGVICASVGFVLTFIGIIIFDRKRKNKHSDIRVAEIIKKADSEENIK